LYGLFWVYILIQIVHFKILKKFFTINDLKLAGEANENLNFVLGYFGPKFIMFLVVTLVMGIITFIFIKKSIGYKHIVKTRIFIMISIILFIFIRWGATYKLGDAVPNDQWDAWLRPKNVYNMFTNSNMSLRVSGIYEFLFRDIYLEIKSKLYNDDEILIEKIKNYYSEQNSIFSIATDTNISDDLTGIFKDKNLIMVMLESIDDWLITEENMPTL
jgi:phosphoglycerol transferase MdoB-like AlkP superfamily enzyme